MSECDICKGCKCGEVQMLRKEVNRLREEITTTVHLCYDLIDRLEEAKKCQ